MGYSIYTVIPTKELRDKILTFLNEHYKSWEKIHGEEDDVRGPTIDVSYSNVEHPIYIGFDYRSSGGPDTHLAYSICYWMSKKLKINHIWYDGVEKFKSDSVDEIGFRKSKELRIFGNNKKIDDIIKNELIRLDKLSEGAKLWQ